MRLSETLPSHLPGLLRKAPRLQWHLSPLTRGLLAARLSPWLLRALLPHPAPPVQGAVRAPAQPPPLARLLPCWFPRTQLSSFATFAPQKIPVPALPPGPAPHRAEAVPAPPRLAHADTR